MGALVSVLNRYKVAILAGLIAIVAVVAGVGLVFPSVIGQEPMKTFTAYFDEAPGLYHDNAVNILGVKTGDVTSVEPKEHFVIVKFEVPTKTRLPDNVRAVLMAPNPISDRTIELYPAYTTTKGKPDPVQLAAGSTIPLNRTAVPLSVDRVFSAVDDLTKTLGPRGANKNGALSKVIKSLANLTDGNGATLQKTLAALATALPTFTANPGQIASLINSLDKLTTTLAQNNATVDSFFTDVTRATKNLADERGTLAAAIDSLQEALSRTAAFVRTNRGSIKGTVGKLATTSKALLADQKGLMSTFQKAALGFQNVNRAIDLNARCGNGTGVCPVAFGRLNFSSDVESFTKRYCRSALAELAPVLVAGLPGIGPVLNQLISGAGNSSSASATNTLCLLEYAATQGRGGSPGAPPAPDLELARFLP